MSDETAIFKTITHTKDPDGYPVNTETSNTLYVTEKSITRQEYYEAVRNKINIKLILEVRQEDFEETKATVDGKKIYATELVYQEEYYKIQRTYKSPYDKSLLEVICI